ncbi:Zn-ribbon-containing protein [Rodentibacter caecimuris]|uniref:Zn-ribbon-containing protein n=1 Tax=Rodentibacter caecimuris TaxID=1796644 RepID=A0ABX3L022_9PAST|nr:hypothetical protein BKG89_06495 [Rodentibacter heylii]
MFLVDIFFHISSPQNDLAQQIPILNQLIDQWRYNGQIIGREIPLFLQTQALNSEFVTRVICPEQHSLLPEFNNTSVHSALKQIEKCGLFFDRFEIIGQDFNSDSTANSSVPAWQILYTTHLQSCSPIHSGFDFAPIPLYKQLKNQPHLSQDIVKWQENWQAYDQLQMNSAGLENQALTEISDFDSKLSKHGRYLAWELEKLTNIPTYYYLYRVGGKSLIEEQNRCCPSCGSAWAITPPLFEIFHFKCEQCRLISNLSWNYL